MPTGSMSMQSLASFRSLSKQSVCIHGAWHVYSMWFNLMISNGEPTAWAVGRGDT